MKLPIILLAILASIGTSVVTVVNTQTAIAQSKSRTAQTKTYKIQNLVFQAPSHWVDYSSDDSVMLYNQKMKQYGGGAAPKNMIKLEAKIIPMQIEKMINPSRLQDMGTTVLSRKDLTISGKSAVQMLIEPTIGAFGRSASILIDNGDGKTIHVTIDYSQTNPQAEKFVRNIFDSVRLR
jgi:hypothetical protein